MSNTTGIYHSVRRRRDATSQAGRLSPNPSKKQQTTEEIVAAAQTGNQFASRKPVEENVDIIYQEQLDKLNDGQILGYFMYLMSPEDLYKHCNSVVISYSGGYSDAPGQKADMKVDVERKLNDSKFGSYRGTVCGSCKRVNCRSHMGCIQLYYEAGVSDCDKIIDLSVYNTLYIDRCAMILYFVCRNCHTFVVNLEAMKEAMKLSDNFSTKLPEIYKEVKTNITVCPNPKCQHTLPVYKANQKDNIIYIVESNEELHASEAYDMLSVIDNNQQYRESLGFKTFQGVKSSPLGFIFRYIPVLPRKMRTEYETKTGKKVPNIFNNQYTNIIIGVQEYIDELKKRGFCETFIDVLVKSLNNAAADPNATPEYIYDIINEKLNEVIDRQTTDMEIFENIKNYLETASELITDEDGNPTIQRFVEEVNAELIRINEENYSERSIRSRNNFQDNNKNKDPLMTAYNKIRKAVSALYRNTSKIPYQARASYVGMFSGGKKSFPRAYLYYHRTNLSARSVIGPAGYKGAKVREEGVPIYLRTFIGPTTENVTADLIPKFNEMLRNKEIIAIRRKGREYKFWNGLLYNPPKADFLSKGIQPGDDVIRVLQDGDIIVTNRNPSIHRFSMNAASVKLIDDLVIRTNLAWMTRLGGDFDGDEMNLWVLARPKAVEEARELMHADLCIISGVKNAPVQGPIMDGIAGSVKMTLPGMYITLNRFHLIYGNYADNNTVYRTAEELLLDGSVYNPNVITQNNTIVIPELNYNKGNIVVENGELQPGATVTYQEYHDFITSVLGESKLVEVDENIRTMLNYPINYDGKMLTIANGKVLSKEATPLELAKVLTFIRGKVIGNEQFDDYMESYINAYNRLTGKQVTSYEETFNYFPFSVTLPDWYKNTSNTITDFDSAVEVLSDWNNKSTLVRDMFSIFINTRTLYSILFPSDFSYTNGNVIIKNGILIGGPVGKNEISMSDRSIIKYLKYTYDNKTFVDDQGIRNSIANNFIDGVQDLTSLYLDLEGFTLGVSDCMYNDIRIKNINETVINEMESRINQLEPPTNELDRARYDKLKAAEINIVPKVSAKILDLLPANHSLKIMLASKGKNDIAAQMIAIFGQQYLEGKPIQPSKSQGNRCNTNFVPGTNNIEAEGFCDTPLMYGLSSTQLAFHSIGSRQQLLDVSLGTADINVTYAAINKSLMEVRMRYGGYVADDNGSILMTHYGLDNLNPAHLFRINVEGESRLSFVDIGYEANLFAEGITNKVKLIAKPFTLDEVEKIINYPPLIPRYRGKLTYEGLTKFIADEGIIVPADKLALIQELETGVTIDSIADKLRMLTVEEGEEILDGYKQIVRYPYPYKKSKDRDVIIYFSITDMPHIADIFKCGDNEKCGYTLEFVA